MLEKVYMILEMQDSVAHSNCNQSNAKLCCLFFTLNLMSGLLLNMLKRKYFMGHLSFIQELLEIGILCRYYKIDSFLKHVLQIALKLDLEDFGNFQILFKELYHKGYFKSTQYFLESFHITNNQKICPSQSFIFLNFF